MKGNYKNRIAALAAEVVSRRAAEPPPPLFVCDGDTPLEAIRQARQRGSSIVYVHWVSKDEAEVVVDDAPDYVKWATPQDCPMSIKRLDVNVATGELVERPYEGWVRPDDLAQYGG